MRIGEVAAKSGVSASRIRFYEAHELLPVATRRGNGYRDYPPSIVSTLRFINEAQALGFSLREIGATLSASGSVAAVETILPALQRKLSDLEAHIAAAHVRRGRLIDLIEEQKRCTFPAS